MSIESILKTNNTPKCIFPLNMDIKDATIYRKSPFHKHPFEHAIDIECILKSEIISPVNGKIIDLKQNSTQWFPYKKGPSDEPNDILNWITIQIYEKKGILKKSWKKTPWIVQFCHIEAFSSHKTNGEFVHSGERLARVGLNGIISTTNGKPDIHLHMVMGRGLSADDPLTNFQSYPIEFNLTLS